MTTQSTTYAQHEAEAQTINEAEAQAKADRLTLRVIEEGYVEYNQFILAVLPRLITEERRNTLFTYTESDPAELHIEFDTLWESDLKYVVRAYRNKQYFQFSRQYVSYAYFKHIYEAVKHAPAK